MEVINLKAIDFKPNLRILKNYFITFDEHLIILYDLKGNILDNIRFINKYIINIEAINDNSILVVFSYIILILKINNKEFHNMIKMPSNFKIKNIIYIKNEKLLVVNFQNEIKIFDINNSNGEPIQVIDNSSPSCLNFNKKIFINYNYGSISIYQKIKGTKIYQLSSKLQLFGKKSFTKLNEKILLVLLEHQNIYAINMRNNKIEQIFFQNIINNKRTIINEQKSFSLTNKAGFIDFIYSNKNNIYICEIYNFKYIKYINNEYKYIESFQLNELDSINYILKKYVKLNNLIFKCNENLYSIYFDIHNINLRFYLILKDIQGFNYYNDDRYLINYYKPKIKANKEKKLSIKIFFEPFIKYRTNKNNIKRNNKYNFLKKNKLNSKKIVNHPKSFKKNSDKSLFRLFFEKRK